MEEDILRTNNTNNWDQITYDVLYKKYHYCSDEKLITQWKQYQRSYSKNRNTNKIAISVCEDLLRQRGNTYLDDHYPRD